VSHALIGAIALAAHGVSRSTADQDLLVTDRRVLDPLFWASLRPATSVDVREGGEGDPLAGVVRLRQEDQRDVDVVVGRHAWQDEVLARAVFIGGEGLPVAEVADVVLLKLYAGGSQDRWDIEQLLALDTGAEIARKVEERSAVLPLRSRKMWLTLRPRPAS
jgi:hypothetical protein